MNGGLVVSQDIYKKVYVTVVGFVILLLMALGVQSNERAHASELSDQKNKHLAVGSINATNGAKPMVLQFDVKKSNNDQYVVLPIRSYEGVDPDVVIEWGDGKTESVTKEGDIRHNYDKSGSYRVTISGILPKFSMDVFSSSYARNKKGLHHLVKVLSFGDLQTESYEAAFAYASRLIEVPKEFPQTVTTTAAMFQGAELFNHPNITHWDVSNVTNMFQMFESAKKFNQPIGAWNVSNVLNMSSMYAYAKAFNQPLEQWDTGNVQSLDSMFAGAEKFNQNINSWDISNVYNLRGMFTNARQFNQPLGDWDTSSVTDMTRMFAGAKSFNHPLDTWDTYRVTDMTRMFEGAASFNQSLENWDLSSLMHYYCNFCNAKLLHQRLDTWDNWSGNVIKLPAQKIVLSEKQPIPGFFSFPKAGGEVGNLATYASTAFAKISLQWSPLPKNGFFEADTVYTATMTLIPDQGYTLKGVQENSLFVPWVADSLIEGLTIKNKSDSGIITIVFPPTKKLGE